MDEAEKLKTDFLLTEYKEAANAYFKGVDIGYTGIRFYITINGLFATVIIALVGPVGQTLLIAHEIARMIPFFALAASVGIVVILRHYFTHLDNCLERCKEIEGQIGEGQLFTRMWDIARGKYKSDAKAGSPNARNIVNARVLYRKYRTFIVMTMIIAPVVTFWLYLGYRLWFLDATSQVLNLQCI